MKINEAKKYLPFVQALAEGKELEQRLNGDGQWTTLNVAGDVDWFNSLDKYRQFRIKPTPYYRYWKPEEVPLGAWLNNKNNKNRTIIGGISGNTIYIWPGLIAEHVNVDYLFEHWTHSIDNGKT